jgi:hypothetical protein
LLFLFLKSDVFADCLYCFLLLFIVLCANFFMSVIIANTRISVKLN